MSASSLSLGTHVITATVTDGSGLTATAAISVIVAEAAPTRVQQRFVVTSGLATSTAANDMTWVFQLVDRGTTPAATVPATYDVSGYWSAPNGDSGAVLGRLYGYSDNGNFEGTLSRPGTDSGSNACIAQAKFTGQLESTSIRLERVAEPDSQDPTYTPLTCKWATGFDSFRGKPATASETAPTP